MDMSGFAFPKPGDDRQPDAVKIHRDGREVCNLLCVAGKREYGRRISEMLDRQGGLCCLCGKPLPLPEATFEHQDGRGHGGGHRDDRTTKDGKPYNGAAHSPCNAQKGSRRGTYNQGSAFKASPSQ